MIGLIGWWRRVENEKSKESKKTGTPDGWKLETDARINFVKQFFPDLSESPGGNTKLNKSGSFDNLTPNKHKVGDGEEKGLNYV